jgi:hypothetical protein
MRGGIVRQALRVTWPLRRRCRAIINSWRLHRYVVAVQFYNAAWFALQNGRSELAQECWVAGEGIQFYHRHMAIIERGLYEQALATAAVSPALH